MLVIPTGTDAPIYHWPAATLAMIVLNAALFVVVPPASLVPRNGQGGEEDQVAEVVVTNFDRYALALGDGLHPIQWLTHNFLHLGIGHLVGNLLFLWSFGIVVEGKLGPLRYLATYLAIGTLHGALVQTLMLGSKSVHHAAGASAIVYGLLAICLIWAPRNTLSCIVVFGYGMRGTARHWEIPYTTVALFYIGGQVFALVFWGMVGMAVVSELGHLSGAFWGASLAIVLLKAGWVDCEGWDMFTVLAKRRELARDWKRRGEALERNKGGIRKRVRSAARSGLEATPEERAAAAVAKVRTLIDAGEFEGALAAYDRSARSIVSWPSQPDLLALIKAMHAGKAEVESIRLMRDHCRYYPEASGRIRLKLAQVLLRDRQRPAEALAVLTGSPAGPLPPDLEKVRQGLVRQAERMRDDGVLELAEDD